MNNPKSRNNELVVQEFEKEVLVYDLNNHKVYTLNETSASIWRMCDGKTSIKQMSERLAEKLKTPISVSLLTTVGVFEVF